MLINKVKAKPNPYSNPNLYQSNQINPICSICNNLILTNNPHGNRYYCKKTGYLYWFRHGECHEWKFQITLLFYNGAKFDFRLVFD